MQAVPSLLFIKRVADSAQQITKHPGIDTPIKDSDKGVQEDFIALTKDEVDYF